MEFHTISYVQWNKDQIPTCGIIEISVNEH